MRFGIIVGELTIDGADMPIDMKSPVGKRHSHHPDSPTGLVETHPESFFAKITIQAAKDDIFWVDYLYLD